MSKRMPTALALSAPILRADGPALAAPAAPVEARAAGKRLPIKATQKTLDGGVKVIVVPAGPPNLVSVTIPVRTGLRREIEPGKRGFAHFFAHMAA